MIYFIPAWYNATRKWYTTDNTWYQRVEVMDFDDIISQLRIFRKGNYETELLVLQYAPNLRRFLHRQNILDVPYHSIFDQIQSFEDGYLNPINYLELAWPSDASFHYNPFIVTVMRKDKLFAHIFLSNDGTLLSIKYFTDGKADHEHVYDDRGFLSSILYFNQEGSGERQQYLNRDGDWLFCEYLEQGQIELNPQYFADAKNQQFASMEAFIAEYLRKDLAENANPSDTIILALHQQHNQLVLDTMTAQNLVLSTFRGRKNEFNQALLDRASALITDSPILSSEQYGGLPLLPIYPYYHRISFGESAYEAVMYVALFIDDIAIDIVEQALSICTQVMGKNPMVEVLLCSFRANTIDYIYPYKQLSQKYINKLAQQEKSEQQNSTEEEMLGIPPNRERIRIKALVPSTNLIETIAKSRVLIDLGSNINYHLSTEAINSGVPQINLSENGFMVHKKNGYFLQSMEELADALHYFLIGLQNWNQSLIYYTKMIDENADRNILNQWAQLEGKFHEHSTNRT